MGGFLASLLTAALGRLWGPVTAAVRLPASVTRHYLSLLLSAVLYFFVTVLRVQPHGYIKVGKVVELQKVIDHLYAQVEVRTQTRPLIDDLHDLSLSLSLSVSSSLSPVGPASLTRGPRSLPPAVSWRGPRAEG